MTKVKYNGEPVWAVACDANSNGCDKCMFNTPDGCGVAEQLDNGDLPDCSDTPGSKTSLGYRVYFTPATIGKNTSVNIR